MFAIAALCVIIGLLYYWYEIKTARMKRLTANMPRPKHYPIIGCALEFGNASNDILECLLRFASLGPVVTAWLGTEVYVIISGVDEIQKILTNNRLLKKASIYDYLHPWLGPGLLTSDGDEWRRQRKIITPAFHFKILEQFVDMFSLNLSILIDKLKQEAGNNGFDIYNHIVLSTLDIITETSMGTRINAQLKKENSFVHAIHEVTMIILQRSLKPWLHSDFIFNISPDGKKFNRQVDVIHKFIGEVIDKKRKEKAETNNENVKIEESSVLGEKKKSAFLDLLIEYNMSDEEIKNQVNTFMFAGHDTTTSAISFTIYCLMKNPEVQEKVYKEQQEILGDSQNSATFQDLKNMKYLECVINETQRLYPSVPYIGRTMTEDFQLTSEYTIPEGCSINIFLYKLHRDPNLFPNPDVFDPDRFLPENSQTRHPFAFCPFSAGPRNCMGQKFAMLELKAVLSAVIRKFRILPPINCPDIVVGSELVLRSRTGVFVRLENR